MQYELTYIIPANYTEGELPKFQTKVRELVLGVQGSILSEQSLGKRKLAYPIKQVRHGYYCSAVLETDPAAIIALERELRLTSGVLRFLVTKQRVVSPEQAEREQRLRERIQAQHVEKERQDREAAAAKDREKEAKPAAPKLTSEELDKRIEQMLGEDIET